MNSKTLSEQMLEQSKSIWQGYLNHPFILGIANGNLEKKKFQHYMIQDYLYLFEYAKVFAHILTKTNNKNLLSLCSKSIISILNGEMKIHKSYMKRLNITDEQISSAKMSLTNISYTSYMLNQAANGDETVGLSAVLSCALSYEFIAKHIVENYPQAVHNEFYGEWIGGYSSAEYSSENKKLENILNELCRDINEQSKQKLIDIFKVCSEYEARFWDMAFNME